MRTQRYENPQKAYDEMNQWTRIKTLYEVQFQGKKVTHVDIMFDGEQPRSAVVHYKTWISTSSDFVDLTAKLLLEKPQKSVLDIRPTSRVCVD